MKFVSNNSTIMFKNTITYYEIFTFFNNKFDLVFVNIIKMFAINKY